MSQQTFSWLPWNLSFRYIHCTGQFTPKMKANAEPRLLSFLVWIDSGVVVSCIVWSLFFSWNEMYQNDKFHGIHSKPQGHVALRNTMCAWPNSTYVRQMFLTPPFLSSLLPFFCHYSNFQKHQVTNVPMEGPCTCLLACLLGMTQLFVCLCDITG